MELVLNLSGNLKIPPPRTFSGKYEDWDEWSWTFKTYLNMMEPALAPFLEKVEYMPLEITDEDLTEKGDDTLTRNRITFSGKLHYLLALITDDIAKLIVRQNTTGNGFETWRLLHIKFTLPGTTKDVGLLSQVMNYACKMQDL